ncbi:MAG: glycosyltransferase family 4 protein [Cellvibrio sp.]|nr:glycosyltransferase family 4 protein [Cellvibrio sp.]
MPLIATLHGRVDINPRERFVFIKQMIMRLGVNKLIAVSKDLSSFIESRNLFPRKAIDVIYNGVDESRYSSGILRKLRAQLGIPEDSILIGSLGNVRPAKSYETLISAVSLLNNPKLHFVIAGHKKKELMNKLSHQMQTLEIEKQIDFIGFTTILQSLRNLICLYSHQAQKAFLSQPLKQWLLVCP